MDIAIVAPCPIPFTIGGAENLWRGLYDFINDETEHRCELIKLPTPEHSFWEVVDTYARFCDLDLSGFDVIVTGKYPAWMVEHPAHVAYLLHRLRGLYDTYHFFGLPDRVYDPPAPVAELLELMDSRVGDREALPEVFARLDSLRRMRLDPELFAFPGPLIRAIVHFLDGVGLHPSRVRRYGATSRTVAGREGYFPPGVSPFIVHPPTPIGGRAGRDRGYLFTVSRLDEAKRVGLLLEAMKHCGAGVKLRIAGTGPMEEALRTAASGDPRIVFEGRVSDERVRSLYAHSRAVAFLPYDEDFGYVALEAMLAAKPVITCTDSGGVTEMVEDGVTGLVTEPEPEALATAIEGLWRARRRARRMGRAGRERAAGVSWAPMIDQIEAAAH